VTNAATAAPTGRFIMLLTTLIARIQDSLAKRARYRRLVAEIDSLSQRDLVDLRADRTDMLAAAHRQVYG
jgi:hypothetical protein